MSPTTTKRDRALRALHLSTGAVTVAAMGATGALTGALAPSPPAAPAAPAPAATPMPQVTIRVPPGSLRTTATARRTAPPAPAPKPAPVTTSGAS